MIRIGDKVRKRLTGLVSTGDSRQSNAITGTVVWIHPKRRYYVAEFRNGASIVRECWPVEDLS